MVGGSALAGAGRRSWKPWRRPFDDRPAHISMSVGNVFGGAWMKRLVEFPLDQGGTVPIEIEEPTAGPVPRAVDDPPDEIGIVFGVQLSAQTGAFIASVAAQANFTVSMTWRRQQDARG